VGSLTLFAGLALFVAPTATTRQTILRRIRNMARGLRKRGTPRESQAGEMPA